MATIKKHSEKKSKRVVLETHIGNIIVGLPSDGKYPNIINHGKYWTLNKRSDFDWLVPFHGSFEEKKIDLAIEYFAKEKDLKLFPRRFGYSIRENDVFRLNKHQIKWKDGRDRLFNVSVIVEFESDGEKVFKSPNDSEFHGATTVIESFIGRSAMLAIQGKMQATVKLYFNESDEEDPSRGKKGGAYFMETIASINGKKFYQLYKDTAVLESRVKKS